MENILAAIDFSVSSKNAANYAASLAGYFGAKLILFHAYHIPALGLELRHIAPVIDLHAEQEEEIKKWVKGLSNTYKGIDIEYSLKAGLAADLIEEVAKEKQCDLIVVGLAGRDSIIKEHVFGSVATKIAETSKIPVLIVPEQIRFSKIKKISFACDLDKSLETNSTLPKVKYFCCLFDAELEILNVIRPEEEISLEKAETDFYLEEKLSTTKHNTFFIYDKKVDKGLVDFLTHYKSDILITCPKTHGFLYSLFIESNTKKLVFHSPIPILTIHE